MGDEENETVILKLLIDSKTNKVLFAEAGKDFVDFLFHIMSLPVGTIIRLLSANAMVGCLGSLYKSIDTLSTDYFQPSLNKDAILNPTVSVNVPLLSLNDAPIDEIFYRCSHYINNNCMNYFTNCSGVTCRECNHQMSTRLTYVAPPPGSQTPSSSIGIGLSDGYVKGVVTYMVMDNLEVKPMSTISGITLMNKFRVNDVSLLVEKEVQVGLKEGLAMLKASMETNTVLTTVFHLKKASI